MIIWIQKYNKYLQVRIYIESFFEGEDFSVTLTRAQFEELNSDLFQHTIELIQMVLKDADMTKSDVNAILLVGGSTRIPKVQQLVKEFFDGMPHYTYGISVDEIVAYGANIHAWHSYHTNADFVPFTIGIETASGFMAELIPRYTLFPTKKSQFFSTAVDNQDTVTIQVYEGERPMARDNHFLGKLDLTGILPAPRGVPRIKVTLEILATGILWLWAEDKGTGKWERIALTDINYELMAGDMETMREDAAKFADEDRKLKERIKIRNELGSKASDVIEIQGSEEDDWNDELWGVWRNHESRLMKKIDSVNHKGLWQEDCFQRLSCNC